MHYARSLSKKTWSVVDVFGSVTHSLDTVPSFPSQKPIPHSLISNYPLLVASIASNSVILPPFYPPSHYRYPAPPHQPCQKFNPTSRILIFLSRQKRTLHKQKERPMWDSNPQPQPALRDGPHRRAARYHCANRPVFLMEDFACIANITLCKPR